MLKGIGLRLLQRCKLSKENFLLCLRVEWAHDFQRVFRRLVNVTCGAITII